ncbi:MAG: ParB N-terminal domain-containing protein [Burkholderiales bacterium]|nr:ParB N-terminal domain-containing protein [Burkholderiales bacterium]
MEYTTEQATQPVQGLVNGHLNGFAKTNADEPPRGPAAVPARTMRAIALAQLLPSPKHNVRRHSAASVEELAALIASQGLLHPLIVTSQEAGRGKSKQPRFEVAAGERRRRALLLLQQRGQLPQTHQVACELVPPERALELSLAENSGREAMHPADEFEAFQALIAQGKGIEDVAARFGVSVLTVQRRLKLSAVSPRLLALYREDGINLDQLMALALSDDHGAQERAWFEASSWDRAPASLRRRLTAGEVEVAGNALVRFVGVEAYEAAGGVVRRDLFDDEQGRYLNDAALLERLATEKLDGLAATVREEGWAWVEARMELDSRGLRQFTPCEPQLRKPTAQEKADLAELAARDQELEHQSRAMDEAPEWDADQAECIAVEQEDIAARRKAIQDALKCWTAEVRAHAGVIVTTARTGGPEIIRGLLRDTDRKALVAARGAATEVAGPAPEKSVVAGAEVDKERTELSDSLLKRLGAHRSLALQAMLAQQPQVALAALAMVFLQSLFDEVSYHTPLALQVRPQTAKHALTAAADDLKDSTARRAMDAIRLSWAGKLPERRADWWDWVLALPQAELIELLAFGAASTLNVLPGTGVIGDANALAKAVGLDMADWWEPTAPGFLSHVSKAQIVQAVREADPGQGTEALLPLKKEQLVAQAEMRLAGKRWLPAPLRQPTG